MTIILGHVSLRQEGGRNRSGRGGVHTVDLAPGRGGRTLGLRRGEGGDRARKVVKMGPKMELFRAFFLHI